MKKIFTLFITLSLLFFSNLSIALLCPTNFNQFDVGNTMEKVIQMCGNPDSVKETKKPNENVPQEWNYYVPQTVSSGTAYQQQGTLKTDIVFDANGRAINISVNGIGVGASTICNNKTIQLGDSRESVQAACGKPVYINKQIPPGEEAPRDIVTVEFTYNTNPPVHLLFREGKLVEKN